MGLVIGYSLSTAARSAALTTDKQTSTVLFKVTQDSLLVESNAKSIGESRIEIPVELTGDPVDFRFNPVFFIEALKDYVVINAREARYTIHSTMKDIEAKLASAEFLRVHRSYIVRLDKIVAIEQPNIILENDKKSIPIGGSYKDELNRRLNLV